MKRGRKTLSHIDDRGRARMVDVGDKDVTDRRAVATARVVMSQELFERLNTDSLEKGDAFAAARIAGIMAAKKTGDLIPLCHPLPLSHVSVDLSMSENPPAVDITAEARVTHRTGVEMEALTAAAVAALTLLDMGKSIDPTMTIERVRLESKSGGKSGRWRRDDNR
jgi:cyclic pyranopterin phosphate synthase